MVRQLRLGRCPAAASNSEWAGFVRCQQFGGWDGLRTPIRLARAVEPLKIAWLKDLITGDYVPYVAADVYRDVTQSTSAPQRRSTLASRSICDKILRP